MYSSTGRPLRNRIPPPQPVEFPWGSVFAWSCSIITTAVLVFVYFTPELFGLHRLQPIQAKHHPQGTQVMIKRWASRNDKVTRISPAVQKEDKDGTTFVVLSDLHGAHSWSDIAIPAGDVLIYAGDAGLEDDSEAAEFEDWLASLPHTHKLVVWGNMDKWAADPQLECKQLMNARVLCNEVVEVAGYKVFGSPYTPRYYGVFQLMNETKSQEFWTRVLPPETQVDVLVTHGPPHGMADEARGTHVGDKGLDAAVKALTKPPKLWVCGHIHEAYGEYEYKHKKGTVKLINAATQLLHKGFKKAAPRTVELPGGKVTLSDQPLIQEKQAARKLLEEATEPWKAPVDLVI